MFDHFFKGDWSGPIGALLMRPFTEADLKSARATLRGNIAAEPYPYPIDEDTAGLKSTLEAEIDDLVWAPGRIVWEDPAQIVATGGTSQMPEALHRRLGRLETELLIESPYFVPMDRGIRRAKELHDRGVRIRLLAYYSLVTLTTVGNGDVGPPAPVARFLAIAEAIFGQLYVAVLVASPVGIQSPGQAGEVTPC